MLVPHPPPSPRACQHSTVWDEQRELLSTFLRSMKQGKLWLVASVLCFMPLWPGCRRADIARVSPGGGTRGSGEGTREDMPSPGSAPSL